MNVKDTVQVINRQSVFPAGKLLIQVFLAYVMQTAYQTNVIVSWVTSAFEEHVVRFHCVRPRIRHFQFSVFPALPHKHLTALQVVLDEVIQQILHTGGLPVALHRSTHHVAQLSGVIIPSKAYWLRTLLGIESCDGFQDTDHDVVAHRGLVAPLHIGALRHFLPVAMMIHPDGVAPLVSVAVSHSSCSGLPHAAQIVPGILASGQQFPVLSVLLPLRSSFHGIVSVALRHHLAKC